MSNSWTKILGDKKEWRRMEARADALPRDYRIVYGEIKPYLWKFTSGDGMGTMAVLREVLDLFESSAAQGKQAVEVTGEDVAAFCDERLRSSQSHRETYIESYVRKGRASLNRDVATKVRPAPPRG